MIRKNDAPEGGNNKFLDLDTDGQRGTLLAVSKDRNNAIILATTSTYTPEERRECIMRMTGLKAYVRPEMDGIVHEGNMYLVSEIDPNSYPIVVKKVTEIPDDFDVL